MRSTFFALLFFLGLLSVCSARYELKLVEVLVRHGARTALHCYDPQEPEWICNVTALDGFTDRSSPVTTYRRSFRKQYMHNRSGLPGNCHTGQLTKNGAEMHRTLGRQFRAKYIDKLNFLPHYLDASQIFIRSSDIPRTFHSAQYNLDGLYPVEFDSPNGNQVINIHSMDIQYEDIAVPDVHATHVEGCPKLIDYVKQMWKNPEWIDAHEKTAEIKRSIASKWNISQDFPWLFFGDNFIARKAHGLPLPSTLTPEELQAAHDMATYEFLYPWQNPHLNQLIPWLRLSFGNLFGSYLDIMRARVRNETPLRYVFYSGHDNTLSGFLSMMGHRDFPWMPYASHLVMELWEDSYTGRHYVRTMFNDELLHVEGCPPLPQDCPLEQFARLVESYVPRDRKAECHYHRG